MLRYLGICFLVALSFLTLIIIFSFSLQTAMAQGSEITIKNKDVNEKNALVVVSKIHLQNIPKIGMLKVIGVINGEGFIKNIPLEEINETTNKLKVNFVMNKDNEFVSASKPDEFFVCAYHFTNTNNNNDDNNNYYYDDDNNKINSLYFDESVYFDNQYSTPNIEYFDCNEGTIQSTTEPTKANLFKPSSLVYAKSAYYYNMHYPSQETSFAIMDDDFDGYTSPNYDEYNATNSLTNNTNIKQVYDNKNTINTKEEDVYSNNSNKPIKVKIIVPMEDKKDAKKIKIMAMLKGQIKSEVIEDVQKEFDKIGGYTIERTFAFHRNTDMGPIQVGDRFHACVIGEDLNPPEGSKCEKKLIKNLDKANSLAAR